MILSNTCRGCSCHRLCAISKGKLKSFQHFLLMALSTCPITFMYVGWGKYPNISEWKLERVRIMLQTPLLVPFENKDNLYWSLSYMCYLLKIATYTTSGLLCCFLTYSAQLKFIVTVLSTEDSTVTLTCVFLRYVVSWLILRYVP